MSAAPPSDVPPKDDALQESPTDLHPIPGHRPAGDGGPWRIAVASDHRGQHVKGRVIERVRELGHIAEDFGPGDEASVDYPDYAARVAEAIGGKEFDRGILICGSGLGMCIVANKFPGVRAVPCHDDLSAEVSRLHNDANVLCLSADLLGERLIDRMLELWLSTAFEGGRHARRLEKIAALERKVSGK